MNAIIFVLFVLPFVVRGQNYSAINGSSFIGSLNVHNNPSAILNSPFKWDITVLGIQDKHTTNALRIVNYSLLSNAAKSQYEIREGTFKRYGDLNANINLFNTRVALNKKTAIAFGANLKSYLSFRTGSYHFIDTLKRFGDFFAQNPGLRHAQAEMATSTWAELYGSFARTIIDDEVKRLNAGITLKVNRGVSGAFMDLSEGNFDTAPGANPVTYRITGGALDFGYSSNYDRWDSKRRFQDNARNFLSFTETGFSFDIGAEYLVKLPNISNVFDEDPYFDYNWKIGLALLDIGYGQYHFGEHSTSARNVKPGVTDLILDEVLDSTINDLPQLRDSLSNVFDILRTYGGKFRVNHPARLVLNVDKFVIESFYINADLSINLSKLTNGTNKKVTDLNLLTITPRWETRKLGYYLPVSFNNHHQLWVGGAIRIGPVLFGVHNWSNLFSSRKTHRGGGYLALILKASDLIKDKTDRRLECP
jgi:hypothetical protein